MELKELKKNILDIERLQHDIETINRTLDIDKLSEYQYGFKYFFNEDLVKEAYRKSFEIVLKEKETELEIKMKKIKEKVLL